MGVRSLGHHVTGLDVVEMNVAAFALGAVVKLLMQIVGTRAGSSSALQQQQNFTKQATGKKVHLELQLNFDNL